MVLSCEMLSGNDFKPLFEQEFTLEQLADAIRQIRHLNKNDLTRREVESAMTLDWKKDGITYTAGFLNQFLIFVSQQYSPGQLAAKSLFACLGEPEYYLAWYDPYPDLNMSANHVVLIYPSHRITTTSSVIYSFAKGLPPELDETIFIDRLNLFGPDWAKDERSISHALRWPGEWKTIQIKNIKRL